MADLGRRIDSSDTSCGMMTLVPYAIKDQRWQTTSSPMRLHSGILVQVSVPLGWQNLVLALVSYPNFTPKPSTHCMHDPGSIVPHIRPKGFRDNQMSQIKYDYYYINSFSKDYDDSQRNETVEVSITPQERQLGQHVA
jgi:hypothetical protein